MLAVIKLCHNFWKQLYALTPNIQFKVETCNMLIPHPTFIVNLAAESILMINILAMLGKVQFLTATEYFDENELHSQKNIASNLGRVSPLLGWALLL